MKQAAIYLYNRKAGLLTEDETGYTFRYDADYLRLPDAEAVSFTLPPPPCVLGLRSLRIWIVPSSSRTGL